MVRTALEREQVNLASFIPNSAESLWIAPDRALLWLFPVLFVAGVALQVTGVLQKRKGLLLPGALLVVISAITDMDPVLGVGQILVAVLLLMEAS